MSKIASLVFDLLDYLQTIDKSKFRQFSCTIDLGAFRKLQAEGYELDDPVVICNRYCAFAVMVWYVRHYQGVVHGTHYVFDQSEPFKEPFEKEWNIQKERLIQGCVFRAMPITVPRRWRSRFRTDADHDSEMMAIAIPTGSRSLFGGSRNGDRHRRNHFLKLSS